MAKSRFWMTPEEKSIFCSVVKNAKLPQVCDSNIARCVQMKEKKIVGYKSHDAHFFMQYLLPIAAKACLHKDIAKPLIRLSAFFKAICNKVIDPLDLDYLQSEISEVLCQFEMIFPPAFFDIMVHLSIHLVEEIRLGGPVCVRWMYPIERYLGRLKSFVRNKSRPEGSMAEAYLVDESVNFCSRYLDCELPSTADDIATSLQHSIFPKVGRPIKGKGNTKKKEQKRCKIEHSGRLRMYGLGVTKASLKMKDPNTPYRIPSVFTQQVEKTMAENMERMVAEQVKKKVAEQVEQQMSYFVSMIREANQERDVYIPDLSTVQEDPSSSHDESN